MRGSVTAVVGAKRLAAKAAKHRAAEAEAAAGAVVYLDGYHPTCKDGSLDMRFKVNRGLQKYGNYVF